MFAGVASAAPPNWVMNVATLPPTVSPGAPAGYAVTITNNGPSNIAALYLVAEVNGSLVAPTVYVNPSQGACDPVGQPLDCALGALTAGQSATVVVAFTTPTSGSSFPVEFQGNATGETFKDGIKGRSHGDTLLPNPVVTLTALNNGKNFAGFFSTDDVDGIFNSPVGGNNKQQAGLQNLPVGVPGSVLDGPNVVGSCVSNPLEGIDCARVDGEWVEINVAGGADTSFILIITYPKNTTTPSAFLHSFGAGLQDKIELCGDPAVAPCFTWDAENATATILMTHNGTTIKLR
jgi:hypothetical protein